MKTKLSGKVSQDLVCPRCGGEKFRVSVQDRLLGTSGHISAHCDCGYGISFNYNIPHPWVCPSGLRLLVGETDAP